MEKQQMKGNQGLDTELTDNRITVWTDVGRFVSIVVEFLFVGSSVSLYADAGHFDRNSVGQLIYTEGVIRSDFKDYKSGRVIQKLIITSSAKILFDVDVHDKKEMLAVFQRSRQVFLIRR